MAMYNRHLTRRSVLAGIAGSVGIMAAAACAQGAATQMPAEEVKAEAEEPKQAGKSAGNGNGHGARRLDIQ